MSLCRIFNYRRLFGRPLRGKRKGFWGTYSWWRNIGIPFPIPERGLPPRGRGGAFGLSSNLETPTKGE